MSLRYCFEQDSVVRTLRKSKKHDLAVVDLEGINQTAINAALDRGVMIYDYLNAGALEKERPYYDSYKDLRIAAYDGWPGEYWVDVTNPRWQAHLVARALESKVKGAIGLYFDNADIYYMCGHGFGGKLYRKAPTKDAVYQALLAVQKEIVHGIGLVCMVNGGDDYVRKLIKDGHKDLLATINQEGVLFEDFKAQSSSERKYRTEYLDWCKKQGLYIRGIEYCTKASNIAKCKAYYALHGWQGLYISKHKNLKGD